MLSLYYKKYRYLLFSGLLLSLFVLPQFTVAEETTTDVTDDTAALQEKVKKLQENIKDKQTSANALQDKINVYQENLKSTQQKELTLQSELESINTQTELTQTQIQQTTVEIEKIGLEQEKTKADITTAEQDINEKQQQIQQVLRELYEYDQQTFLEVALSHSTLSEFSAQVEYTKELNNNLKSSLDHLVESKNNLQAKETELKEQAEEQATKRTELTTQHQSLQGQADYKDTLLNEVQSDEAKFQELVQSIKKEQASIDSQITSLEKNARQTLDQLAIKQPVSDTTNQTPFVYPTSFSPLWPVSGPITARFHDPSYPFRRYFEHNAIDIATPQGTPVKAADSGVVGVVKYDGSPSFAYIMIVHADNFSTLYGHVSKVFVSPEEPVQKGQVIALSGALPGSPGAGPYTTGPHLHFAVYKDGIPVDPVLYLP